MIGGYFLGSAVDSLHALVVFKLLLAAVELGRAEPGHFLRLELGRVVAEVLLDVLGLVFVSLVESEGVLVRAGQRDRVLLDFFSSALLVLGQKGLPA